MTFDNAVLYVIRSNDLHEIVVNNDNVLEAIRNLVNYYHEGSDYHEAAHELCQEILAVAQDYASYLVTEEADDDIKEQRDF